MSDIKLFRIADNQVTELEGRSMALEKSLQALMEDNMEALLGVRFLASEYSTGHKHKGRIDSLGIDENGCPVIIEYKRSTNENVINQGLFYLDWLMDHKGEFELLVLKCCGKEASDAIEWGSPRLMCIAGDFTRYDEHAVQQINRNIELIRYRHFPEGYLLLEMVNAVTATSNGKTHLDRQQPPDDTHEKEKANAVPRLLKMADQKLQDLFHAVEDHILSMGDDITRKELKHYNAYSRLKNFACLVVKPQYGECITAWVNCPPVPENIIEGFSRDVSKIGHLGTGNMELTIKDMNDLERAKPLFEQSYQRS